MIFVLFYCRYNDAHSSSCVVIENTFGMWKSRFAVIMGVMRHDPTLCTQIITATACLHNFAISQGDMWVYKGDVKCIDDHDPLDNYHYWSKQDRVRELNGKKV